MGEICSFTCLSNGSDLTGVAVSFAPLFLYWCGQGKPFHDDEWFVMPLCFAVIFLVPLVYFRLGSEVAKELRKKRDL
jgi:hypothetical protein